MVKVPRPLIFMNEKSVTHKIPKIPVDLQLTNEAVALLAAMSERMRLSPDAVVEHALIEKAERDGVMEEVREREDLKEAFRRLGNTSEPNVPWSQIKTGKVPEAPYSLELKTAALAEWKRLPLNIRSQLTTLMDGLCANPEPADASELKGLGSLYRIRSGGFHVTYIVQNAMITVLIIKSGKRG